MSDYELYHHGILGMKWGVRRYQYRDGGLTPEGKKRYYNTDGSISDEGKAVFYNADGTLTKFGKKRETFVARNIEKNWYKSYNKATAEFNNEISNLNKNFEGKYDTKEYVRAVGQMWTNKYKQHLLNDFGESLITGKNWVDDMPLMNMYLDIEKDYK